VKIHHYADSLATATPRDVVVSDETLAKLAKVKQRLSHYAAFQARLPANPRWWVCAR